MFIRQLLYGIGLFFLVYTASATDIQTGMTLSYPLITQAPPHLQGYHVALWYQPSSLLWNRTQIFFSGGWGRWWIHKSTWGELSLNAYSLSPVLRYYFKKTHYISPFLDVSVGLSYLSRTRLGNHRLGIHFAFQDQVGVGISVGTEQRLYMSINALHYSNGGLCKTNAGITVPVLFNLGYCF